MFSRSASCCWRPLLTEEVVEVCIVHIGCHPAAPSVAGGNGLHNAHQGSGQVTACSTAAAGQWWLAAGSAALRAAAAAQRRHKSHRQSAVAQRQQSGGARAARTQARRDELECRAGGAHGVGRLRGKSRRTEAMFVWARPSVAASGCSASAAPQPMWCRQQRTAKVCGNCEICPTPIPSCRRALKSQP